MSTTKKRYEGFDILKFICAFLVICIHCPFPKTVGEYFTALSRVAVPIFFMITGYFYRGISKRKLKKIFLLAVGANILYLIWDCLIAIIISKEDIISHLLSILNFESIINFLIFNESPVAGHLWYLGAVLYVLLIAGWFQYINKMHLLYILTPILLVCDLIFGKYSLLIFHVEIPYIFVRNFLFVGIPNFCIGIWINKHRTDQIHWLKLVVLFSVMTIVERYILVFFNINATRDSYITTVFLSISLFCFFREIYNEKKLSKIEIWMAKVGREISASIYIIHPIFIDVMSFTMKKIGIYYIYMYIAPIVVFITCIVGINLLREGKVHLKKNEIIKRFSKRFG